MASDLDEKELKEVLSQLIDVLIKKGILPPALDKMKLVDDVAKTLMDAKKQGGLELNNANLRDPSIVKGLATACMAQLNPSNKFDYTILFKSQAGLNEKEVHKQLDNVFSAMLLLKFDGKKVSKEKELFEEMSEAAKITTEQLYKSMDHNLLCENKQLMNLFLGCVDATSESELRRQFYGADKEGEVQLVVFQILGDLIGALDLSPGTSSENFMSERDNPRTADPYGSKILEFIAERIHMADNPIDTPVEVQDALTNKFIEIKEMKLDNESTRLTPLDPRKGPTPYGG